MIYFDKIARSLIPSFADRGAPALADCAVPSFARLQVMLVPQRELGNLRL